VRDGLATLPWVEKDSVDVNASAKMVTFGIKDKSAFDFDKLKAALAKKYQTGLKLEQEPR
jgi:hypothetical protein